jgi:5-hydroxyisourate hydrolase
MISTHVLDTSIGRPAAGVRVSLLRQENEAVWRALADSTTDANGRISELAASESALSAGVYRLSFDVAGYFRQRSVDAFYTTVTVEFIVKDAHAHYHVPLLVSPYGYSTYRGS